MRLSTDPDRDDVRAGETIAAAAAHGITVFDTAHAYGRDERDLGHNERLLARALRECDAHQTAHIVTKGGMTRVGGAWVPDGRAKSVLADCEASLEALDGIPIDVYLLHAPDPRTPWRTSVRALARLLDDGVVRRVGVSNVNRRELDEALELAPISAVEVALSLYDDRAVRGGILERCVELGIALIAHSPFGGPRRAPGLARRPPWTEVAAARGVSAAEVALAWALELSPAVIPIPGARHPETARSAAHAARLVLDPDERAALSRGVNAPRPRPPDPRLVPDDGEVVLVMGIPGAGKSRVAEEYVARGYLRLNRDDRGGALGALADLLDDQLASGVRRVVLDNTYLSRATRSYVIEAAARHETPTRCVWLDTALAQAQVNLVERLLDRCGTLPTPPELRALARREQGVLTPTSQMRTFRELEPPSLDEGFAEVEILPFTRAERSDRSSGGVFVAAAVVRAPDWERALEQGDLGAPHLVFDWSPAADPEALDGCVERLAAAVSGPVQGALCPHPAGPPSCWCRPPLPGLPLAFARARGIAPSCSVLIGATPTHRTLSATLGARYVSLDVELQGHGRL